MSGEALRQEIRKGAEDRAKKALEEAKVKAAELVADADAEAKRVLSARVQDATRRLEQVERSEEAKARMECTKNLLTLQSRYVEQAFDQAGAFINNLPANDPSLYRKVMTQFILEAARELGGTGLEAVVRKADRAVAEDVVKKIGEDGESGKPGFSCSVSDEPLPAKGGVVLRAKDMRSYFINTFDSRILQSREALRAKVIQTLLGGEGH